MRTVFGWRLLVDKVNPNPRTLMNFLMQANGAEMMHIVAIAAMEAGIQTCAPVHDAFLIEAPIDRIDADVAKMREIMTKAGRVVTGIDVRVDIKIVRYPDRYMDKRGAKMFGKVMAILDSLDEGLGKGLGMDNGTGAHLRAPTCAFSRTSLGEEALG
jgi:hypothetical protein